MPGLEHTARAASPAIAASIQVEAMRAFWTDRLGRLERLSERDQRRRPSAVLRTLLSRLNHLGEPSDPRRLVALDRGHIAATREREAAISTYILITG